MLKIGDKLPASALQEFIEVEGGSCSLGPNRFDVAQATAGKTIAIFALPGAYTPTCSAQHVPGYVQLADELKAAGVDEIWCVSVNDAYVMGAWARDQRAAGKVRRCQGRHRQRRTHEDGSPGRRSADRIALGTAASALRR